ncbi:glycosyl transferase family 2 [Agromyces ramosus]|uniref:Glycosyl transferase family 2 n=1 Tax=Agromyces ramosus TaxID=33879 RepID=A0A4Q7M8J7_9MICO|nr:glycosyltransferase family A protein [Agromyces ramosus]RZS63473.1 glycosyl transferase family 2 [Agromyces ramosus]
MTGESVGGSAGADVQPIVSVVIPLYNGAAYIAQTLTSISRQTLENIEVIVVDDGSTDDGPDLVRTHPVGASLHEQSHLGVAVARNRGLMLARGRWVAFLDQDDLWHPTHLERALRWLHAHPGEHIVFVREITFGIADETDRLRSMDSGVAGWATHLVGREGALEELTGAAEVSGSDAVEVHDLRAMLRGPISVTTSFVAQPELLRLVGGFAPHALAMDDYWMLVNVARLQPIPQIDQRTVFYRVHVGATSRSTRLGMPFLSSAIALRLGGGLIGIDEGLRGGLVGKLHSHLLRELLTSPEYAGEARVRRAVGHLASLLWPPHGLHGERRRALIAARLPWLRRAIRTLRGGLPPAALRHDGQ